jgi:hypothetical protein
MFVNKAEAYPNSLLALPTNIRLGREGLPGTNTLAYYERLQITAVKKFIASWLGMVFLKSPTSISSSKFANRMLDKAEKDKPGNTKGVSIIAPLTSCLTGLD